MPKCAIKTYNEKYSICLEGPQKKRRSCRRRGPRQQPVYKNNWHFHQWPAARPIRGPILLKTFVSSKNQHIRCRGRNCPTGSIELSLIANRKEVTTPRMPKLAISAEKNSLQTTSKVNHQGMSHVEIAVRRNTLQTLLQF